MIRLLVTRPSGQAGPLADALRNAGFEPICVPTAAIEPPDDGSLQNALRRIESFDWLVVTSANAVPSLAGRIPATVRVAAVGATTAAALRRAGIAVDHVPDEFLSAAIARGLGALDGRRVLLARADAATPELSGALAARGATVTEGIAYRTVVGPATSREPLRRALATPVDGVVFASASAVRGLFLLCDDAGDVLRIPALCIGPVTAAEARAAGFDVAVVADDHTASGLAAAITQRFAAEAMA